MIFFGGWCRFFLSWQTFCHRIVNVTKAIVPLSSLNDIVYIRIFEFAIHSWGKDDGKKPRHRSKSWWDKCLRSYANKWIPNNLLSGIVFFSVGFLLKSLCACECVSLVVGFIPCSHSSYRLLPSLTLSFPRSQAHISSSEFYLFLLFDKCSFVWYLVDPCICACMEKFHRQYIFGPLKAEGKFIRFPNEFSIFGINFTVLSIGQVPWLQQWNNIK